MARFLIIHNIPEHATQDQLFSGAKQLVDSLGPGVEWLDSYAASDMQRLFCFWEAPSAEAIQTALGPVNDLFPVESMHEVEWIDPKWYK